MKKPSSILDNVNSFLKNLVSVNQPIVEKQFSLSPARPPIRRFLDEKNKGKPKKSTPLPSALQTLQQVLKGRFHAKRNPDFVVRTLSAPWSEITIAFYNSISDRELMQSAVVGPLLEYNGDVEDITPDRLTSSLTYCHIVNTVTTVEEAVEKLVNGMTFIHVDNRPWALVVDLRDQQSRGIESPRIETVIPGPYDAFVEVAQKNLSLLRMRLAIAGFVAEALPAGRRNRGPMYLLYIDGLTDPKIVREMRRRLKAIDVDMIYNLGMVEQYIQDQPRSLFSQVLITERPDRTVAYLLEGSVAVLLEGSPLALIAPVTFWAQLHSPEDIYFRWPIGTFSRIVRLIGLFFSLYLPALYVAMVTFHPEMLPTELMLSIAAARERVPFPSFLAVLFLELAFEFIREAALRVPKVIGTTIGIVGAVIIGQAVVQAGIVSPVMIIVMAITVLAGFSMPQYTLTFSLRLVRLINLLLGTVFGFYGILLGLVALICHATGLRSLGMPFLVPVAPAKKRFLLPFVRRSPFIQEQRPGYTRPKDIVKAKKVTRPWDPTTPLELIALQEAAGEFQRRG
ncbi:spore germination protein [Heliobacterium undosum]|uniref:Spore germination protein n=1 Tax=Heliomicrobium undosum TaxID=121734 RepID=A0A845L090_9FIRM|nr:spore germination protein [Heliomicrobium undosum]MZP28299.1 spore germination protein [Heliomicrobium undosum]